MACSSDRNGHDIVLLSMASIFWGTLDVLSLVPGAHLPVKASRFHPQIPGLSAHPSRRSAQNGLLPSLSAARYSFPTAPVPRPSGHRIPRPFGQPAPALRHGTAFSLTFRSTRSGTSARNGILPNLTVRPFRHFGTERCPDRVFGTARTELLPPILTKAAAACFACRIAVSGRS